MADFNDLLCEGDDSSVVAGYAASLRAAVPIIEREIGARVRQGEDAQRLADACNDIEDAADLLSRLYDALEDTPQ